jgi:hypothetical protein
LPLHDLAKAIPGILVAALLPGYALATLLAPRWRAWERLAASPGLSAGFFGVLGLGMRVVHVPFEPLTVIPATLLLVGAAFARRRWAGPLPATGTPWWIPIPALVAGCAGAAAFAWALHGQVLPPDWDPRVHATVAASIARTHDVLPLFPIPLQNTAFARIRPGFEAMTAVVSWIGGPDPAMSMAPIVTAVLVLMPLGLTLLALEATGSVAFAVVVPLLAAGLAFPSDQAILGRFPQLVDSVLVSPYIVATLRLVRGRDVLDHALLLVAFAASIWVLHGLEVITTVLVGGGLIAWAALAVLRTSPRQALLRIAVACAATLASAAVVTRLMRLPHTPAAHPIEPSTTVPSAATLPFHPHQLLQVLAQTDLTSPLAVALYSIGIVAILLVYRRLWWVLLAHVIFLVLLADSLFWHKVNNLSFNLFPYGETDRVVGLQYWVIPFILGAGFLAVLKLIRAIAAERRLWTRLAIGAGIAALLVGIAHGPIERVWSSAFGYTAPVFIYPMGTFEALTNLASWRLLVAASALVVLIACVVACRRVALPAAVRARFGPGAAGLDAVAVVLAVLIMVMLGLGVRAEFDLYTRQVAIRSLSTQADVNVLHQMSARLAPGTLVLTDGLSDAGVYLAALTDLTPLVPNGSELGTLSLPLVTALANACTDPAAAEQAVQPVGAVFVGSHDILGASVPWNADCIGRLPNLRLVASDSYQGQRAVAFAVVR